MSNESFRDAYQTLQKNAEKLRNQREPDLDNLLDVVTQSVAAYKVCKSRIDAVEQALEQALSNAGLNDGESAGSNSDSGVQSRPVPPSKAGGGQPSSFGDDSDEDIPF